MKLTAEQLEKIMQGAERITEEKEGFRFHRFTVAQEEYYLAASPENYYLKACASAGVSLAFCTDSETLKISAVYGRGSSRGMGFTDIEVNGEIVFRLGAAENALKDFSGTYPLGKGEKTVRVYFPQLLSLTLKEFSLDDGAKIEPLPAERNMLIFGDSITQGYDALYPTHSYAARLTSLLKAHARNKGIGGEMFAPRLALLKDEEFHPEIITVAYGTNDFSCRKSDVATKNIFEFYDNLSGTYPHAKIFAISPVWRGDKDSEKTCEKPFEWLCGQIRAAAEKQKNAVYVCGAELVPHDPACYSPDLLHPNDLGFATYAERLYAAIKESL